MNNFIKILMALALILASGEAMAKKPPPLPKICLSPPNDACKSECEAFKKGMSNPGMVASACSSRPPPKGPWCPLHQTRHANKVIHPCGEGTHVSGGKCVPDAEGAEPAEFPWLKIIGIMMLNNLIGLGFFFFFSRHRRRKEDLIRELITRIESAEGTSVKTSGQLYELIQMLERRQLVDSDTTAEELLAMLKGRCVIPGQTDEGVEFQQNLPH